jgi:hypothetical protein
VSLHRNPSRQRRHGHASPANLDVNGCRGCHDVQNGIERKRNLLAEKMLRYFGETCPALAPRCEIAIVGLPPLDRREVAGRLQTLRAVTNETNRELTAARVAFSRGQAPAEFLLDRALASIEHLSEVADIMTRWMDELLNA